MRQTSCRIRFNIINDKINNREEIAYTHRHFVICGLNFRQRRRAHARPAHAARHVGTWAVGVGHVIRPRAVDVTGTVKVLIAGRRTVLILRLR